MSAKIKRREFITLLGGAAAWPLTARAQQIARMRRLGVVRSADAGDPEGRPNFLHSRRSLQYWVGPMAPICEWRFVGVAATSIGHRFLFVALQPDVILAQGTPVTAALKRETRRIPIVFATVLAKRRAETYDCVETC